METDKSDPYLLITVHITNGRKGTWYEKKVGKEYRVLPERLYPTDQWEVDDGCISRTHLIEYEDCEVVKEEWV